MLLQLLKTSTAQNCALTQCSYGGACTVLLPDKWVKIVLDCPFSVHFLMVTQVLQLWVVASTQTTALLNQFAFNETTIPPMGFPPGTLAVDNCLGL